MNHNAIVARITKTEEIVGADKIHIAHVLGERVVVSKDWGVGFVGVLFPVEVQLSEQFAYENNLYRDSTKNKDTSKKGFFDTNRRVRSQPFLKVKSEGFFCHTDALSFTGKTSFQEGETFQEVNGIKLCEKYVSAATKEKGVSNKIKAVKVDMTPFFEKHVDSDNFKHYASSIPKGALLSFHAKVHGTSARMAYTSVKQNLNWLQKLVNKIVMVYPEYKYDYVVGTRNVVLYNPEKEGFHGSEKFRFDVMEMVKPFLEEGMIIYGEIAGYVNGKPIMGTHNVKALKDKTFTKKYGDTCTYSYGCKEHEFRFHVYRITRQTSSGHVDMTQKQLEAWCEQRGLLFTHEVHPQIVYDGDEDRLRELVDRLTERPDVLCEDYIDPTHISEGIIIRVDNDKDTPKFYKSKSYAFRVMEGLCESVDTEDAS